jgi:hypothetical protein
MAPPLILQDKMFLLQPLFKAWEFDPFEFASFDPDKDHILLTQTIMIRWTVVIDAMTTL